MVLPTTIVPRASALALASALACVVYAGHPGALGAQTLDDGLLLPRHQARIAADFGHDQWRSYWEGDLRRTNDNIGTLTTSSVTAMAGYGATERLSLFATLPYVWTRASAGVLHGLRGRQDLTVAAKYRVLDARVAGRATLGALVTAGAAVPTSNYTVDLMPMSIGFGSRRAIGRATVHLQDRSGFYTEGAAGRAWRGNVRLDRPAYYTDGRLYSTNEVEMPDVADYRVGVGFQRGGLCIPALSFVSQRTLGGGDIRRQDMPFVSNRVNLTQLQSHAMLTTRSGLLLDLGAARVLTGRNVGRSTSFSTGLGYAFGG